MAPVLPMQQTAVQCCSLERPQELCPQDLCLQRLLAAMGGQQDGGGKGGKGAPPTVPGTGAPPRPPLTGGHSTLTWKCYHSTSLFFGLDSPRLHQATAFKFVCFQFCLGWTACDQGQAQWREQMRTMWYNYRQPSDSWQDWSTSLSSTMLHMAGLPQYQGSQETFHALSNRAYSAWQQRVPPTAPGAPQDFWEWVEFCIDRMNLPPQPMAGMPQRTPAAPQTAGPPAPAAPTTTELPAEAAKPKAPAPDLPEEAAKPKAAAPHPPQTCQKRLQTQKHQPHTSQKRLQNQKHQPQTCQKRL